MGFKEQLNAFYKDLDGKAMRIKAVLNQIGFKAEKKYYNGHYYNKDAMGNYVKDYYPIPVIEVEKLCDIEVVGTHINISTKMLKINAMRFNYELLKDCYYEVYGVVDYLSDYYKSGESLEKLYRNLAQTRETEIGFAFSFGSDVDLARILYVIMILRNNGFYY